MGRRRTRQLVDRKRRYLAKNPEIVAKLVRAINRGMAYSAGHPVEAAETMLGIGPRP